MWNYSAVTQLPSGSTKTSGKEDVVTEFSHRFTSVKSQNPNSLFVSVWDDSCAHDSREEADFSLIKI